MSNPTGNFSSDLDPYDRLAQMLDGGLFKLLPLPPSWAKYVGAQYAPDPSLLSAPASATPGFDKSPMFAGVGTTTPGFRPLPMAPAGDTPGFDKSPAFLGGRSAAVEFRFKRLSAGRSAAPSVSRDNRSVRTTVGRSAAMRPRI